LFFTYYAEGEWLSSERLYPFLGNPVILDKYTQNFCNMNNESLFFQMARPKMAKVSTYQSPSELIVDSAWPGRTVVNDWQVLRSVDEVDPDIIYQTTLLDVSVLFSVSKSGEVNAWIDDGSNSRSLSYTSNSLKTCVRYGYIWASLGDPNKSIFDIPEYEESDRRNIHAGTIRVNVSAPRVIENFLDLAHFAFVHPGSLGQEPYTEIKDYDVEIHEEGDEVRAQRCRVWQPLSNLIAKEGFEVDYIYRVPHPYCAILYKANAKYVERMDAIALFVQPAREDVSDAHMLLSVIDDENSDLALRSFQQQIFGQDKPILENQIPKRLPLDLRAETSVRCDATSTAYRRWLHKRDVRFGTIPQS
jgi:hypothetical protein